MIEARERPRRSSSATAWLTCAIFAYAVPAAPAAAQERVRFHTDVTIYGDNTEFHNRFRDGATLLGTAGTFAVDVELGDSAFFRGGIFLNHRIGSARFAEQWRPVFSLTVDSGPSRFIFGTLDSGPDEGVFAPDLGGPHGLIPPLQVETLAYERPHEGGLQWQLDARRLEQDAWINWQRLNTAEHRERFDAGLRGRIPLGTPIPIAVAYQLHHVHEGGQLFDPGPVADSFAGGPGLVVEPPIGLFDASSVEAYVMWSKHVPDRADPAAGSHGHGLFVRAAAVKHGWRGHFIFWSGCLWLKDEGDRNYGSRFPDGSVFRPTRHYGEVGLARIFYEAEGVSLEGSARAHRIEKDYNYSFRVLARVHLDFPFRRG